MTRTSTRNVCQHPGCIEEVDEPGLLCRVHWRKVPRVLREQYIYARKLVLKAVKANEELR